MHHRSVLLHCCPELLFRVGLCHPVAPLIETDAYAIATWPRRLTGLIRHRTVWHLAIHLDRWKESLLPKYLLIFSCNCILRSHLQVLEVYLTMASAKTPQSLIPVFLTAEVDHKVGELVYVVKRLELMGLEGAQFVPWRNVGRR